MAKHTVRRFTEESHSTVISDDEVTKMPQEAGYVPGHVDTLEIEVEAHDGALVVKWTERKSETEERGQ